ncbi:MAG: class I SAM-dependent methyltransferase [Caldilineaceae bacterium]|nr:class I SAM-dependent methyltransferase [Caldilineaceae bacterium]
MKKLIRTAINALGYDLIRHQESSKDSYAVDISADDRDILNRVAAYTMTGIERQITLVQAVRYLVRSGVQGCFVECGVWKGGSSMACAFTLLQEGDTSRHLYLFDTFEGMTPPQEVDRTFDGQDAARLLEKDRRRTGPIWCLADIDEVQANMAATQYPQQNVHCVKGPVEDTLPAHLPSAPIALLRLDTDWYESTRHELIHLFPLLCKGGVLIVDDYGQWAGAKRAVDEYLAELPMRYFLQRIDYTGRLLIK